MQQNPDPAPLELPPVQDPPAPAGPEEAPPITQPPVTQPGEHNVAALGPLTTHHSPLTTHRDARPRGATAPARA